MTVGLKIAFFGSSLVSAYWNGAATYYRGIAAGAGACIITDAWEGIELFLEPGREILVAQDGLMVAEHMRQLTPSKARTIGDAARKRILAEHTYTHRATQLEAILSGKLQ